MINVKVNSPVSVSVSNSETSVQTTNNQSLSVQHSQSKISIQSVQQPVTTTRVISGNSIIFSGKSPYINSSTGTWWVYDDQLQQWKDTNVSANASQTKLKNLIIESDDVLYLKCGDSEVLI